MRPCGENQTLDLAVVYQPDAPSQRVRNVCHERPALCVVRAALPAETAADAAAHVQLERLHLDVECRRAPREEAVVLVDGGRGNGPDIDPPSHVAHRCGQIQSWDAVVGGTFVEREAGNPELVAPASPYGRDGIEAQGKIHRRPAPDTLAALHRVGAIGGRAASAVGPQDAHVEFALVEEGGIVIGALLNQDDTTEAALGERRGDRRTRRAGADNERIACQLRHRRSTGPL
jgi:hypothetical protein